MKPSTLNSISSDFLRDYLISAFWTHEENETSGRYETGSHKDDMFSALSPEAYDRAAEDCRIFQERNAALLSEAYQRDYDETQAGHDFWLTRNGHGTGFWDRQALEPQGEEWEATQIPLDQWTPEIRATRDRLKKESPGQLLTKAAKCFGEINLYRGDDGQLYF